MFVSEIHNVRKRFSVLITIMSRNSSSSSGSGSGGSGSSVSGSSGIGGDFGGSSSSSPLLKFRMRYEGARIYCFHETTGILTFQNISGVIVVIET